VTAVVQGRRVDVELDIHHAHGVAAHDEVRRAVDIGEDEQRQRGIERVVGERAVE